MDQQDSADEGWDEDWGENLQPICYDDNEDAVVASGGLKDLGVDLEASQCS